MADFYKYKIVVVLHRLLLCFIPVLLFACAGGETKQGADEIEIKKTVSFVDIDSDVERDFKKDDDDLLIKALVPASLGGSFTDNPEH